MSMFDEIEREKQDLPKIHNITKEVSLSTSLNGDFAK